MTVVPDEKAVVERIARLYLAGASYQAIADSLNKAGTPFCPEVPLWNKHKVKRLLENPRYTGTNGYPAILDRDTFYAVQAQIRAKTEGYTFEEKRPALKLKDYLRCPCGGTLRRISGTIRRKDTLYLKCAVCGAHVTILDEDLLVEVSRQMVEYNAPKEQPYIPNSEVIRITNAINRRLEHSDAPENVVSLILQGISARYDCCPTPTEQIDKHRLSEADFKRFGQTVSHITITGNLDVTIHFK